MARNKKRTRSEVAKRVNGMRFNRVDDLLFLDDYEFEQWCSKTAKAGLTEREEEWVEQNLELALRWRDGLLGLVESTETQLAHAERELESAKELMERTGDSEDYIELSKRQADWKPKIQTFQKKINQTLREAERRLSLHDHSGGVPELLDRIKELEEGIAAHRRWVLEELEDTPSDAEAELWELIENR